MPKSPAKATKKPLVEPPFWVTARETYGQSFGATGGDAVQAAIDDWMELDDSEQQFYLAHLAYLQLEAQAYLGGRLNALLGRAKQSAEILEDIFAAGTEERGEDRPADEEPSEDAPEPIEPDEVIAADQARRVDRDDDERGE